VYKDNVLAVPTAILQNPLFQTPEELAKSMVMVEVMHHNFSNQIKRGRIVMHELAAPDTRMFFKTAFNLKFPIHSVIPVCEFGWSDIASCEANNSSGQNMRYISDSERMSKHGPGCAFDINPHQNPCFDIDEDLVLKSIIPSGRGYFPGVPGSLQHGDELVELMISLGWSWGGFWKFPKDYQHFQKVYPELAHYYED
jgi:hypothetical protein